MTVQMFPGVGNGAIIAANVQSIGIDFQCQIDIIVDDQRNMMPPAQLQQASCLASLQMPICRFVAILNGLYAAFQRLPRFVDELIGIYRLRSNRIQSFNFQGSQDCEFPLHRCRLRLRRILPNRVDWEYAVPFRDGTRLVMFARYNPAPQ